MKPILDRITAAGRAARSSALVLAILAAPLASHAQTTLFGALTNFDVYNDTGQDAHGFEIELDGVTQVPYYFSSTRYGGPTIVPFQGGVYVRYASAWNVSTQQFMTTTQVPASFTPTTGHSCVLTFVNGCDHYGVSIYVNPTSVVYRWLVADPANPGQLIRFGTNVSIPTPVVTINPPPQPAQPPVVVFRIEVPPPPPPPVRPPVPQYGEAKWVKVYKTEVQREVGLDELVGDNPVVPQDPGLVETAWKLLQTNPHNPDAGVLISHGPLGNGSHSVVRRYEFTKYAGKYDPLTHEALCVDPTCSAPDPSELGDYIGSQMAAANVGVPSITVTKVGNGTVNGAGGKINCGGSCTTTVAANTAVTLTANAAGGLFSGWSGACNGADLNCTLNVNDQLNVTATFTPVFTLSIGRGGNGTVTGDQPGAFSTQIACGSSCSAKFAQGTTVTLTATPPAGHSFVNWAGACAGSAPTCSVTISKDTQVQANFK